DSSSRAEAEAEGLEVLDVADAASRGEVVMILLPDEKQAEIWREEISDGIADGNLLMFAHGFAIRFGQIEPPPGVDVGMVAPKGPGHLVRREFTEGQGVPCLMAIHQDATGTAREQVLAYASGIGGGRAAGGEARQGPPGDDALDRGLGDRSAQAATEDEADTGPRPAPLLLVVSLESDRVQLLALRGRRSRGLAADLARRGGATLL